MRKLPPLGYLKFSALNPDLLNAGNLKLQMPLSWETEGIASIVKSKIKPKKEPPGKDEWRTDALETGEGDCEDYAIATMIALLKKGYERHQLRLVGWDVPPRDGGGNHITLQIQDQKKILFSCNNFKRLKSAPFFEGRGWVYLGGEVVVEGRMKWLWRSA